MCALLTVRRDAYMPTKDVGTQAPPAVDGSRQEGEIRFSQFLSPPQQAHDDKGSGKKRTPEPRTRWHWGGLLDRDRIQHGGHDGCGKDADASADGRSALVS